MEYFKGGGSVRGVLWCDPVMIALTRELFPADPIWGGSAKARTNLGRFDGVVLVPAAVSSGALGGYSFWLSYVYRRCAAKLRAAGFVVDHYLESFDSQYVRCEPYTAVVACRAEGSFCEPVSFQLGGRLMSISANAAVPQILEDRGERLLDAGVALIAVTHLALRGRIRRPIRVECPGTRYSPKANEKFDDVLRIDFEPPIKKRDHGYLCLDWNWASRARRLHGVGSAQLIKLE